MKEEKLLPCPFCGSEAVTIQDITGKKAYHVCCDNTKCFFSMGLPIWCGSKKEAIKAWNTRAKIEEA